MLLLCDFVLLILGRLQKQGARCQKLFPVSEKDPGRPAAFGRVARPSRLNEQEILQLGSQLRAINMIVASAAVDLISMFTFYKWRSFSQYFL
jgi:hypothetical protein